MADNDRNREEAIRRNRRQNFVAIFAILLLLLTTSWLWVDLKDSFPALPEGFYIGRAYFPGTDRESLDFMVQARSTNEYFIGVLEGDWESAVTSAVDKNRFLGSSQFIYPLTLHHSSGKKMRLIGKPDEKRGGYAGVVKEGRWEAGGRWYLESVSGEASKSLPDMQDLRLWIGIKDEIDSLRAQERSTEEKIALQREQIDKLTSIIFGDQDARLQTDQEYQAIGQEVALEKGEIRTLELKAQKLREKVQTAREVRSMGKLVTLARKTMEREERWIVSMFKTVDISVSVEDRQKLQGLELSDKLNQEIAEERKKIKFLQGQKRYAY